LPPPLSAVASPPSTPACTGKRAGLGLEALERETTIQRRLELSDPSAQRRFLMYLVKQFEQTTGTPDHATFDGSQH
jgi:hypothetical protein